MDRIDEYLSACQLGITMASLGIGFMGEPAIANLLEGALGGVVSHGLAVAIAISFAYLVTTALHITVGEQVPKIYSIVHAEKTATRTARLLQWFRVAFKPLIWLLNTRVQRPSAAPGGGPEGRVRGDQLVRGPQAPDRPQRARGQARPR